MKMALAFNQPFGREAPYAIACLFLIVVFCTVSELLKPFEVRMIAVELRTSFPMTVPAYKYEDIVRRQALEVMEYYMPQKLLSRFKIALEDEDLSLAQKKELQLLPINDASFFKSRVKWRASGRNQITGQFRIEGNHNDLFSRVYGEAIIDAVSEFNTIFSKAIHNELFEKSCNTLRKIDFDGICSENNQRGVEYNDEFCQKVEDSIGDLCSLTAEVIPPFHLFFESELIETVISQRNMLRAVILGFIAGAVGSAILIIFLRILSINKNE